MLRKKLSEAASGSKKPTIDSGQYSDYAVSKALRETEKAEGRNTPSGINEKEQLSSDNRTNKYNFNNREEKKMMIIPKVNILLFQIMNNL